MKHKLLAYLLVAALLLSTLPLQVFAADTGTVLTQVTGVSVGAEAPWEYSFTLDTTGVLNITIGNCSPGWQYKLYYPDGSESIWFTASAWSLGGPVQDVEITETGTYGIALYAYNASKWSNVDGTVSATLTFTPTEIEQQLDEWALSDTYLTVGANELTLDESAVTTIYEFSPDETGTYAFSANDAAALVGHWGYGSFYIVDNTPEKTNTLECTFTAVGQTAMIGVSGVESTTLTIEKIADYSTVVTEWSYFENTEFSNWADYVIDTKSYEEISVIDNVDDVIVKGDDGLYHYGSADGRVVVANLNGNSWLSFGAAIESGATFRIAYKDENGNYPTGLDMTDAIKAYASKGLYPLTDELIYMLKEVGNDKGWYDPDKANGYYLFEGNTVDPETAYLAFCGTVCEHTWIDADCENAKTCEDCGKTEGDPLGHNYQGNICTGCGICEYDIKFQTNTDGTAIRLLSYVGDLSAYANVKFSVTINGNTTELVCTNAYKSLLAGGKQVAASDVFGENAEYFVMYTITGITEADYANDMTITVTWTSVDGTETTSETRTVNIGELVA